MLGKLRRAWSTHRSELTMAIRVSDSWVSSCCCFFFGAIGNVRLWHRPDGLSRWEH